MADPLLEVRGLNKRFGGIVATDNLDLDVAAGEIHELLLYTQLHLVLSDKLAQCSDQHQSE